MQSGGVGVLSLTGLHLGRLSLPAVINSIQADSGEAGWTRVFSVSVEEDLLTWVFPFCKPYLTPRRGGGATEKKRLGSC